MKDSASIFSIFIGTILLIAFIGYVSEEPHDHRMYQYEHPSSINLNTTFIICGDTALVGKDTGTHISHIPKHFKEQMD